MPHPLTLGLAALFLLALAAGPLAPPARAEEPAAPPEAGPLYLVMNYPYQVWAAGSTRVHVVLFKPDFSPAAGATVAVNGKPVGTADAHGACIFDYTPGNAQAHELTARLEEGRRVYTVRHAFQSNARTESYRSDQVFVYTDRGVYNPGQPIHVRCLAWELTGEYAARAGAKLQLLLQDAKEKVVNGGWITTNEFGAGAIDLPLADNMPEGNYQLVVLFEKARETAPIRVKRFVPPILAIEHDLKRYLTPAQSELPVEVKVGYFSGAQLAGATVALEVLERPDGATILKKELPARAPGRHAGALDARDLEAVRARLKAEQPFQIKVVATDSYGQTDTVTRDVVFTERPYRAVLELDKDDYPQGEEVQLLAKVVDLDGKPAAGIPLTLTVTPFQVKVEAATDAQGVATFRFKMGGAAGAAVVTSPVMKAPLAERPVPFNQPKPMTSKVASPPAKAGLKAALHVDFDPGYLPVEKVIHVDLTDISGALVAATTIPVTEKDGRPVADGEVTAPTWGTMLVNLYCCAIERANADKPRSCAIVGFITEGQHVTFYPDREVAIELTGLKPRVKPGEKVEVTVKARPKEGGEACLGAALVDRAVISLLDPLEKTPMDRFYNPQLKVISTGGSAVLTWPIVDRTWGEPNRDIAYANWGWKAPGGAVDGDRGGAGGKAEKSKGGAPAPGKAGAAAGAAAGEAAQGFAGIDHNEGAADAVAPAAPPAGAPAPEPSAAGALAAGPAPRRAGAQGQPPAPPKTITIRTRFPETALWEPLLVTQGGERRLTLDIPDDITVQRLSVVASDPKGGVGLRIEDIEVRQDLFVRSALPAALAVGDEVWVGAVVRNTSGKTVACKVRLESEALKVLSEAEPAVTVEDGGAAPVRWKVRADRCGRAPYRVVAAGEAFEDSESRVVFVTPVGEPGFELTRRGTVTDGRWRAQVRVEEGWTWFTTFLSVSFPNRVPVLQGYEAMARYPHGCTEQVASAALLDAAVLEYGLEQGGVAGAARALELRSALAVAAARLVALQRPDGGWGWFVPRAGDGPAGAALRGPNLYLTAYALRALAAIREADVFVPESAIASGVEFLFRNRNPQGLWSGKGAFFWEATNAESDAALSAEVFAVLATVLGKAEGARAADLKKLADAMAAYVDARPQEPLGVASAVEGLLTWAEAHQDAALRAKIDAGVEHLIALKRGATWEPHWYHAYGGMVELNARILEVLQRTDRTRYEAYVREGVTWLLATRPAWGAWHNTMGTAAAVRALARAAAAGGPGDDAERTVEVRVNGAVVKKVTVDPKDPFLSAAGLRLVELTAGLKPGENEVEVVYDGKLAAPVVLEARAWPAPGGGAAAAGADGPADALKVRRKAPETARVGEPVPVTLEIGAAEAVPYVLIEERIPATMEVDPRSLDALRASGAIADWKVGDALYLYLEQVQGDVSLTYKLTAAREGVAVHAGTTAVGMYDETKRGSTAGGRITVTAGE